MTYHQRRKNRFFYIMKQPAKPKPLQLSSAIEGFLLSAAARQLSSHTISDYKNTLRLFLKHTGNISIGDITAAQISAFLACQTEVKAKTVLNYHVGLSALWTWAIKQEYIEKHVVRMVEPPKPDQRVIEPYSELEIRAMFNGIRYYPDRDRAMLLLLLDTGLRASELCSLKRENIDIEKRHIRIIGKGRKERIVPFSTRTASALFKYLVNCETEKIFPLNRDGLLKHLKRIGARAGVQNVHPHRFRHTMAVMFLKAGGDVFALQDILGHSSLEMVRIYIKIANTDLEAAHKRASPVENLKL